jgi:nucleoside 2-deoxyribosyltransferase
MATDLTPLQQAEFDNWLEHGRKEVAPKMASSAFVISLNPDEIDPKIALETGYAVLLNKPIMLLVRPGQVVNDGLRRLAKMIVILPGPLESMEAQMAVQAGLAEMARE